MVSHYSKFNRLLSSPTKSFLLLGPRGVGKSTWLKHSISPQLDINLLKSDQFIAYQADPSLLRHKVSALKKGDWVIIDEVQRVPELLNEVHYLYESMGLNFALTGSSARKLKRANANLLAGRAIRYDMFPLTFGEMADETLVSVAIDYGTLPYVISSPEFAADTLSAYVETYLREEIAFEALTRNLEPFARFLRVAAQHHGQLLNVEAVGSEAGVKRTSVDNYFQILEETLLGYRLPALRNGYRAKEAAHPKFYFFDAGVARAAAGWLKEDLPDAWRGFAFETVLLNEVRAFNSYRRKDRTLYHYTVTNSFDVDLVIETKKKVLNRPASYLGIEVKMAKQWKPAWTDVLLALLEDSKSGFERCYGVYLGNETITAGVVTIYSFRDFCRELWEGKIF